jgi:hypothetical protein
MMSSIETFCGLDLDVAIPLLSATDAERPVSGTLASPLFDVLMIFLPYASVKYVLRVLEL